MVERGGGGDIERQAIEQISMLRCEIPRQNGTTTTTTLTKPRSFPASLVFLYFSYIFPLLVG